MDGDKFESSQKNMFQNKNLISDEENFFMQSEKPVYQTSVQTEPLKHLNDYDSNILSEDAYKDVQDEVFKLEYKISKTEDELKEINKQIQIAKEVYDYFTADTLSVRKNSLETELAVLMTTYNELSLSAKISGDITSKFRGKILGFGKKAENIVKNLISKIPGKISSVFEIKSSLNKLENINKSVDELMSCRYPHGEADYRYEQLSKYIARANSIQSEIYKFMK